MKQNPMMQIAEDCNVIIPTPTVARKDDAKSSNYFF
jgi:hypothetical protein